jgi:hypothetical protein
VKKSVYFALLAVCAACVGVIQGLASLEWPVLLAALVLILVALALGRSIGSETKEQTYCRTYEASRAATYTALCGALGSFDYKITASDPAAGTLQFSGGTRGPWIGRLGAECTASVRRVGEEASEIVIAGHAAVADRHGRGLLVYPEGMRARVTRILDQVDSTVISYSVIHAALAEQREERR